MKEQRDVVIVGGGMVGAASALGLAKLGLNITIIENKPLPLFSPQQPYDLRISAISASSIQLLEELGAWQAIQNMRVCPYNRLKTWEIDGFSASFDNKQLAVEHLGYMIENNVIQLALWQALEQYDNVNCEIATNILESKQEGDLWHFELDNNKSLQTPLVIAADGANSKMRQQAGIGLTGWQYRQECMLIVAQTELPQQDITWQQFHSTGPRAFLPLLGHQGCLVWYDSPKTIARLSTLTNEQLDQEIATAFPAELGQVKTENFASFPLTRRHAQCYYKNSVVLIGDSAHTINPLAGQGVNLGFKDVKALIETIEKALKSGQEISDEKVLHRYQQARRNDNLLMQSGMDFFYKTFKEDIGPLKFVRNAALVMADKAGPIKNKVLKYALGL